jgi:predicted Zn-dependent protease
MPPRTLSASVGRAAALCGVVLLAGCSAVQPVHKTLAGRFVLAEDARSAAAERVSPVSRGDALGAQLNLSGRRSRAGTGMGGALLAVGTVPAPEVERHLERMRDRLLAAWPHGRPATMPRIEVVGSRHLSAAALSDGTVQVSLGLLQQVQSEDELAFALGHELGHLLMHHQLRRQEQVDTAENIGEALSQLAALGGALSGARASASGELQLAATQDSRDVMQQAALGRAALGEAVVTLIDPGWSRKQEQQADLVGLDLMAGAGYDPRHAQGIFDRIIHDREAAQQQVQPVWKQLLAAAAKPGGQGGLGALGNFAGLGNLGAFGNAAAGVLANVGKEGYRIVRSGLRERHPEPKDREQWASEYRDRWHAEALPRAPQTESLARLRATRDYQNAVRALEQAYASQDARDARDTGAAVRAAQAAVSAEPDWWGGHYTLALAFSDANRSEEARAALAHGLRLRGAPYPAYALLADMEANANNRAGALAALDLAAQQFGSRNLVLPDRIALHRRFGDGAAVQADQAQCARAGNPRLRDKCQAAGKGADGAA